MTIFIDFIFYFAWYERIAEQKLTPSQKEELKQLSKDELDYCLHAIERRILFGKVPFDRKYFMNYLKAVLRNYREQNPVIKQPELPEEQFREPDEPVTIEEIKYEE